MKKTYILISFIALLTLVFALNSKEAEAVSIEQVRAEAIQILSEQLGIIRQKVDLLANNDTFSVSDILVPPGGRVAENVSNCIDDYEDEVTEDELRGGFIEVLFQQVSVINQSLDMILGNTRLGVISIPPPSPFMERLSSFMSECLVVN